MTYTRLLFTPLGTTKAVDVLRMHQQREKEEPTWNGTEGGRPLD